MQIDMTPRALPYVFIASVAVLIAAIGCQDRPAIGSQKQMKAEDEAVQVARAATEWVRENQFVRQYPDSLEPSLVRAVAKKVDGSVEATRREMRRDHCVGCPPAQRVDPEAFAITWPGSGNRAEEVSEATIRAAKGLAEALGKLSGEADSFLNCTTPTAGSKAGEECTIRGDVQSLLSFEQLDVNGDTAEVRIRWFYKANVKATLPPRSDTGIVDILSIKIMRDMELVRRDGGWTVGNVRIAQI